MPARSYCKCCNQMCESHLLVTCCICKEKYKHSCVEVTTNELRTLNANKGYDWTCKDCRVTGKDLKDLKALIIQLQNDIKDLKAENARIAESSGFSLEDVIEEISERQKRKSNVMLFNVEEPDQNKSVREQTESDINLATNILNTIAPDISLAGAKVVRLGPFAATKVRPVKIILNSPENARKILMNSKKLKNHNIYKKINVSADRTKKQLDHYKRLKQELLSRHATGDTNCRIKYINDIPRIIQVN
nr:unnamed protein product [Callosobruchus analis]